MKKPAWLSVWITLLLLANHDEEHKFIWNGKEHILKRGQFITGRKALSDQTGVPKSTIEDVLRFLELHENIRQQKTTKYRLITILNWSSYQKSDNKPTTERQQSDTFKKLRSKEVLSANAGEPLKAKKGDMRTYNENQHSGDDLPDLDLDSREIVGPAVKKKDLKKASPVEEEVFSLFDGNPARAMWGMRPIERAAAKILYDNFGMDELERRMGIIRKNENEPWCPQIDTPAELLEKMSKMEKFLKTL